MYWLGLVGLLHGVERTVAGVPEGRGTSTLPGLPILA